MQTDTGELSGFRFFFHGNYLMYWNENCSLSGKIFKAFCCADMLQCELALGLCRHQLGTLFFAKHFLKFCHSLFKKRSIFYFEIPNVTGSYGIKSRSSLSTQIRIGGNWYLSNLVIRISACIGPSNCLTAACFRSAMTRFENAKADLVVGKSTQFLF